MPITVAFPGVHLAGQTSPCFSTYWKACKSRRVSSTFLPTGASLIEECLNTPLSSIKNVPRRETPFNPSFSFSTKTP